MLTLPLPCLNAMPPVPEGSPGWPHVGNLCFLFYFSSHLWFTLGPALFSSFLGDFTSYLQQEELLFVGVLEATLPALAIKHWMYMMLTGWLFA